MHTLGPFLRDQNTIYTLVHAGWDKGKEVMKNDIWFGVHVDKGSSFDKEKVSEEIQRALNSHGDLLEALELMIAAASFADETGYIEGHGHIDIETIYSKARAAIAKAKGE